MPKFLRNDKVVIKWFYNGHLFGCADMRRPTVTSVIQITAEVLVLNTRVFATNILTPDSKVYGANMGPTWGRQDQGEPHAGPMNFAIWDSPVAVMSNASCDICTREIYMYTQIFTCICVCLCPYVYAAVRPLHITLEGQRFIWKVNSIHKSPTCWI